MSSPTPIKLEIEGKKYVAYPEQSEDEKKRSWRPKKNTTVYILTGDKKISKVLYLDSNLQRNFFDLGYIYLTRVEAESELIYRQALQRVKEWIYDHDAKKYWEEEKDKFSLCWHALEKKFQIQNWTNWKHFSPFGYLKSNKACEQLIQEMDSDLRIIFNV